MIVKLMYLDMHSLETLFKRVLASILSLFVVSMIVLALVAIVGTHLYIGAAIALGIIATIIYALLGWMLTSLYQANENDYPDEAKIIKGILIGFTLLYLCFLVTFALSVMM